jgi:RNA polymerase sigma-70 factor (ECF subfamily)
MNFDSEYLARLRRRDPETCTSFVSSLTPVLEGRLRCKFFAYGSIEDVRNETFCRVFIMVDRQQVRKPAQLGSFVRGVCDRVALEVRRQNRLIDPWPEDGSEPPDPQPPIESLVAAKQMSAWLKRELLKMSEEDRRLLIETHFEERDRCQMARERGVTASGLNTRLCRAMKRLKAQVLNQTPVKPRRKPCRRHAARAPRWATMAA